MINNILLFLLLLFPSITIREDSIKLRVNDSSRFEGTSLVCEGDTHYRGVVFNNNMKIQKGFFRTKFNPIHYREVCGIYNNNDIVFFDEFFIPNGLWRIHGTYEKNSEELYYRNHLVNNYSNRIIFSKNYFPQKKEWSIVETRDGPDEYYNYRRGTKYNHDGFLSNSEKTLSDSSWYAIINFIMALCGMLVLLWPFHKLWTSIITTKIVIGVSVIFHVIFFMVFSNYERIQIVNFIIVFIFLFWGTSLIKNFKIKNWARILVCSISCPLMVLYCFINTSEQVELEKHQYVSVSWAPGTDFVKRGYLKKTLKNLLPVPIEDDGFIYNLYLNKYEFSEVDFRVVTDDLFNWMDLFFKKKPLGDFSYRECRLLIDKINMITGLTLDMPTVNEWECATAGDKYVPPAQIEGVKKGIINRYGLVNIASNAAEYTSNYNAYTVKLSLDADSLISAYDFIAICRGDSIGNHRINFVEKNSNESFVTFRLAYRPQNIGKRKFKIYGYLRKDCQNDTLPQRIRLVAINNQSVDRMPDYETFQELVIENRFTPKYCQVIDVATNIKRTLSFPKGVEYYDYIPMFSFEGLPKRKH